MPRSHRRRRLQPSPTATPGPSLALTPYPLAGAVPYPAEALNDLHTLEQRTAELRGLQPTADVPAYLIGRDAAADYLISTIEPDDKAAIELHQEVYRLLGLIPPNADLLALELSLLKSEVLGFYDPDVKSLFVLDDLGFSSPVTRLTLVHEFTHALQDQHYGITSHEDALNDDWDGQAAWVDLIEGDARSMETTFLAPTVTPPLARFCAGSFTVNPRSGVPPVIQRELNTPYTDGLCFVRTVGPQLPKGDDSILEDPPASTEQILQPDKYLAHEAPRKVDLPDLRPVLGAGWQQIGTNNLGEFTIQNLLLLGTNRPGHGHEGRGRLGRRPVGPLRQRRLSTHRGPHRLGLARRSGRILEVLRSHSGEAKQRQAQSRRIFE